MCYFSVTVLFQATNRHKQRMIGMKLNHATRELIAVADGKVSE